MSMFSLRTIIDDIMLIVRNNNISESEDLSRAQIAAWVLHYRAALIKEQKEKEDAESLIDETDDSLTKSIGPIRVHQQNEPGDRLFTFKTAEKLEDLLTGAREDIIAVYDDNGNSLQAMDNFRNKMQRYRKFTFADYTYDLKDGYIYITGASPCAGMLRNIWITYMSNFENEESEDDVDIPGWMIPRIKDLIFKNELAFMVKMPSDDDNNSTLDGIKPHGAQDQEE